MELNFSSVETIPSLNASAAFQVDSCKVFKEDVDMVPTIIDKSLSYMPWGGDNMMPYNILKLIEDDETLSTCQQFNAEVCYGSGLKYDTEACTATVKQQVEDFLLDNVCTRTSWVQCQASRRPTTAVRTSVSYILSLTPCRNPITTCSLPCIG